MKYQLIMTFQGIMEEAKNMLQAKEVAAAPAFTST
jgi:hypothetical protein